MGQRSAKGQIPIATGLVLRGTVLDIDDRSVAVQELIMTVWRKLQ